MAVRAEALQKRMREKSAKDEKIASSESEIREKQQLKKATKQEKSAEANNRKQKQ
jgi:hypothetical protein